MDNYKETYRLSFNRQEGDNYTNISVSFEEDYLPDVLTKMREFLNAAGFTYVDKLVGITENGKEYISDDV